MCGIAGLFGTALNRLELERMAVVQHHRGPDDRGSFVDPSGMAALAHNRLSIIDLSSAGHQPMANAGGNLRIVFNGEIYNFLELRGELSDYQFRTTSDTEVILAAYERWGESCLDHLLGMFSFLIWDIRDQRLFGARDRFGVKPMYYALSQTGLAVASEIRALHAAGVHRNINENTWASYLAYGLHDHSASTFWDGVSSLGPGHALTWDHGRLQIHQWYDLPAHVGPEFDSRPTDVVCEEYLALLLESIQLRFRSDVEVGINISGGLDSSTLLALIHRTNSCPSRVKAFTYTTGHQQYDEFPWVQRNLKEMEHPSFVYQLRPEEIPDLATDVQAHQDEPFGGLPTLAYARLFELARRSGVVVLLDGQGMDEQWAGYDYYAHLSENPSFAPLQGTNHNATMPGCLTQEFLRRAEPLDPPQPFPDKLRNRQYLDTRFTKIPRALRFNDRVSMRASAELREPFMDHRLFELAFRQPKERKILNHTGKWLLREMTRHLLPCAVSEAPKRPVQTPQREWLAGPLRDWTQSCIETMLLEYGGTWFDKDSVMGAWNRYRAVGSSNSYYVWQWISLGLTLQSFLQGAAAVQ